jgi:putative inorganic carbon (hco3(-)) transporter
VTQALLEGRAPGRAHWVGGVGWAFIAGGVGLLIATQPLPVALALLASAGAALLAAITPLAALVMLLVLAPMRTLIATEARVQLPLDIGQLALIAFLFFWLVYRVSRRQPLFRLGWSPVMIPVLVFFAAASLTAFSPLSMSAWLTEWLKWAQILVLIALVLTLAKENRWQWLIFGLTLAGVANGLIGIYEFFGGSGALHLLINNRFFRAFGTFGQPNPFGGFMGLLAPVAIMALLGYGALIWKSLRQTRRLPLDLIVAALYYAVASAVLVVGVFISWSRGAWLGFGVSLLVMAFALPRKASHSLAALAVILVTVGVLWSTGRLPASVIARINSATEELFAFDDVRGVDITSENYAVVERLAHWQAALNMTRARPFLGVGMGNYEIAYSDYRLLNWKFSLGHAHNYYLNVLAEAGIIGLIGYISLWSSVIYFTWRARQHPNTFARFVVIGLLGTWSYLSIHSLTDDLYVNNLFLHIGVMLGVLAVLYNQSWTSVRLRNL